MAACSPKYLKPFKQDGGSLFAKLCPTLLGPHGLHPTISSVHGDSQARILELGATSSSMGSNKIAVLIVTHMTFFLPGNAPVSLLGS